MSSRFVEYDYFKLVSDHVEINQDRTKSKFKEQNPIFTKRQTKDSIAIHGEN